MLTNLHLTYELTPFLIYLGVLVKLSLLTVRLPRFDTLVRVNPKFVTMNLTSSNYKPHSIVAIRTSMSCTVKKWLTSVKNRQTARQNGL